MLRTDVEELHYITSSANLASIMSHGILSHLAAAQYPHTSVASEEVQNIRRGKYVPGAGPLHNYANLYFDARNPMLFKLKSNGQGDLVVLRVSPAVLDIPGTVVCDGNAACNGTRFFESPAGLSNLDKDLIFAKYWTDDDPWMYYEKKRIRCAEVLVPGYVHASYIQGCYVRTGDHAIQCRAIAASLNILVNGRIYFDG